MRILVNLGLERAIFHFDLHLYRFVEVGVSFFVVGAFHFLPWLLHTLADLWFECAFGEFFGKLQFLKLNCSLILNPMVSQIIKEFTVLGL